MTPSLPAVTLDEIRIRGFEALCKELGPEGALRFVLQYELGRGDYGRERRELLDRFTVRDVLQLKRGADAPAIPSRGRPGRRR